MAELGRGARAAGDTPAPDEIRWVLTVFREVRKGQREDGMTKPVGAAVDRGGDLVMTNGWTLAAHFGDGGVRAADVALRPDRRGNPGPVHERAVWPEYREMGPRSGGFA